MDKDKEIAQWRAASLLWEDRCAEARAERDMLLVVVEVALENDLFEGEFKREAQILIEIISGEGKVND